MWRQLRELMRGMKSGFREFHRSSEEIQDEMNRAMEVPPQDESDHRPMRTILLSFALLLLTHVLLILKNTLS